MSSSPPARSLASQYRRHLLGIAIVLLFGLLPLVATFSIYEIDAASDGFMRMEASRIATRISSGDKYALPQRKDLSAYRHWSELPKAARDLFGHSEIRAGTVVETEHINSRGIREYVYLLHTNEPTVGELYLLSFEDAKAMDATVSTIVGKAILDSLLLTCFVFLLLFAVLAWIFWKSMKPLYLLTAWSAKIREQPDSVTQAHFSITELNEVASHLLSTLNDLQSYNRREREFLRHASHELRTPLATLQASLDTLTIRVSSDKASQGSLQRALRSSSQMIELSNTLLWLARESDQEIPRSQVCPGKLCEEIASDMAYLIEDKAVETELQDGSQAIDIEEPLLRIVASNLIRNAFQYAPHGVIRIQVTNTSFIIENELERELNQQTVGYGIGLQLVERIANKLGWCFTSELNARRAVYRVAWQ